MRILFAVSNNDNGKNDIVDVILDEYQRVYKKIISYKRAFYFDAIIDEVQQTMDNRYDLIVISEDLEKGINESYDSEDENLYRHIDEITDEAYKEDGTGIPHSGPPFTGMHNRLPDRDTGLRRNRYSQVCSRYL